MSYETFYPVISSGEDTCKYIENLTTGLFVASSFAGSVLSPHTRIESIPLPRVPLQMTIRAADWGGYRVVRDWQGKPPFSPEQYVSWLSQWQPEWAAAWDYPCGDTSAAESLQVVRSRQDETTLMAWYFWHHYKHVQWCWTVTIQGYTTEDYQRHAEELMPLIMKMREYYHENRAFRVGIGSLVGRKPTNVKNIIDAVARVLPANIGFHAWGLKKKVLESPLGFPRVKSSDTGAYGQRFGGNIEEYKQRSEPQREIVFHEKLPTYTQSIYRTTSLPKQYRSLFETE